MRLHETKVITQKHNHTNHSEHANISMKYDRPYIGLFLDPAENIGNIEQNPIRGRKTSKGPFLATVSKTERAKTKAL